ncbi:MAG TPA: dTDP-glucose 4,6-dehydratase [Pirellulales bacterium]
MGGILLTGGAGFIGGAFVEDWLASESEPLVNLDKLTYAGCPATIELFAQNPRHRFVRGDVADRPLVAAILKEHRPRAVVHFAAETHVDRSIVGPAPFATTNVIGTAALLDACRDHLETLSDDERRAFRFLHISTDEVFGELGPTGKFTEDSPYRPNSPYAASKAAADHFVRAYGRTYGFPAIITHCSNNYGPRQHPEKLIPLMISQALAERPLPVYGDGKNVRDWLFVRDHVAALKLVLARGRIGESYAIGGDCEQENLAVVELICERLDRLRPSPLGARRRLIRFTQDRPGHDRRYAIDPAKIQRELGWRSATSFEDGLAATVRWHLENPTWLQAALEHARPAASKSK